MEGHGAGEGGAGGRSHLKSRFHGILIRAIGEGETYNLTAEQIALFFNGGQIEEGGEQ